MNKKTIGIGLVVLVLFAAVIFLIVRMHGHTQADGTLVEEPDAVLIQDQAPGDETIVSYAKLSKPGYVVVYTQPSSGQKEVLGSSDLLPAGEHKNVHVHHHHKKSSNGSSVSVAIVADDGDGAFAPETDTDVLVPDTGDNAEAVITEDAELDTSLSDEELTDLLDDAGYETGDDTSSEDAPTLDTSEEGVIETPEVPVTEDGWSEEGEPVEDASSTEAA